MSGLGYLATELTDNILQHLQQADLVSVARVCKRLSSDVKTFLYGKISLTWTKGHEPHPPVHLFLRSIAENPDLSRAVLDLKLQTRGYTDNGRFPERPERGPKPTLADTAVLNMIVTSNRLPERQMWEESIAKGGVDAMTALLLIVLPSLQRLHIGVQFLAGNPCLTMVLDHMLRSGESRRGLAFEHLRSVRLGTDADGEDSEIQFQNENIRLDPDLFLPFLGLAELETAEWQIPYAQLNPRRGLSGGLLYLDEGLRSWPLPDPKRAEHLKHLRLHRTQAPPSMLFHLLQVTSNLETLGYTFAFNENSPPLDLDELGRAIGHINATVRVISVAMTPFASDCDHMDVGPCWLHGSIGRAVKQCHSLEKLEVAFPVLLGWYINTSLSLADVFPSSLRSFRLRDDLDSYADWEWSEYASLMELNGFLRQGAWKATSPVLEEVSMQSLNPYNGEWGSSGCDAFRTLVEGEGLRCDIVVKTDTGRWHLPKPDLLDYLTVGLV